MRPQAPDVEVAVSDATLLERVREDDEQAMRELIRKHEGKMYAAALRATRHTFDAQDVVGVAMLELWRRRDSVRLVGDSALPWLLTVVSFAAKNQLRGQRRHMRLLSKLPRPVEVPDHSDEVLRMIGDGEMSKDVKTALRTVIRESDARDASILVLCLVEGMSTRDAAQALGTETRTVGRRLARIRAKLQKLLAQHDPRSAEEVR